jgi:release factor glutamine methyltransferase
MRAGDLIDRAERTLIESPAVDHWQRGRERIEAEELLDFVLGHVPDDDADVPPSAARRYSRLVAKRATGMPVPQITGFMEFRGLRLRVRPGVFIPRDSSEWVVVQAVRRLARRVTPVAVDLATGAGPIALGVANEVRRGEIYGADISKEAVALARENARALKIPARFVVADVFDGLPARLRGHVDVVTFHPPYLGRREIRELPEEISRFEPHHALTDRSPTGTWLIERAAAESEEWLRPGGWMLVEVSPDRSRHIATILRRAGLREVRSTRDPTTRLDVSRVVVGRR